MLDAIGCQNFVDGVSGRTLTRLFFNGCLAIDDANPLSFSTSAYIDAADSTATIRQKMIDAMIAAVLAQFAVVLVNADILLPTYSTGLSTPASETRTDSFTVAGAGQTVDTSLRPLSVFSLTVDQIGGVPVSWNIVLEGSLDGISWTTILTHTQLVGTGLTMYSGSNRNPCLFFRSRCAAVALGTASALKTTILGIP